MRVYRIVREPYADLTGEGARINGGRWNSRGRPMVYAAEHPALAMLEIRVHLDLPPELQPDDYVLMTIETGDVSVSSVAGPVTDHRTCGDEWLASAATPVLKVESVLLPSSYNFLINPAHPDASRISIEEIRPLEFDPRLWALNDTI